MAMAVNGILATIIEVQKVAADEGSGEVGKCFLNGSGCQKVQTSTYASIFYVSNPILGIVVFSVLIVLLVTLMMGRYSREPRCIAGTALLMGMSALFSAYLLYLQFFVIHATCIYCLWVDGIMILSALVFIGLYRAELKKAVSAWKSSRRAE